MEKFNYVLYDDFGGSLMKYKMLVIDDEVNIVGLLKDFFEFEDFLVYTAYDGEEALKKIDIDPVNDNCRDFV